MPLLKILRLAGLLSVLWQHVSAQALPLFQVDRRTDTAYMDSLARLARQQYQSASGHPATAARDTLRLEALYYLGRLYGWWEARRDSSLHFARNLSRQARACSNVAYEAKAILLHEYYAHYIRIDYPEALRLNYQARAILQKAHQDPMLQWRIDLNLGELYSISGNYENALAFLNQARIRLARGSGVSPQTTISYRASIEQKIGAMYNRQDNFPASEKHYLAAEAIMKSSVSETGHAFVYDDLGELYLKYRHYDRALVYAKKAEAIWNRLKPRGQSNSWGTLACVYSGLGQDELALQYAQKVLQLETPTRFVLEQAYMALYQVYERREDWKSSNDYYRKYVAIRDTIANRQRSRELAALEKKAEFDRITLQNEQARQLQTERLLTMEKQAELDRLRASARTDALAKKARISEQQRLLDNERAETALSRQHTTQRLQRQRFEQQMLVQKNKMQQNLLLFSTSSSVLLLGALALLLYSAQLRKRKAEADLKLAHERKEADARIIQTQETERQRIAADLHDDLGGTLATLRRRLTDLRSHLHGPGVQSFDALQPLIQKSTDDLRRIAHNLMPPEFARIGLRDALEQLVGSQPVTPTRFSFVTSGAEQRLPLDTELNAYRIVSELIQNIGKHAQANRAAVQLLYHDDRLTITVEDDGLGSRAFKAANEPMGIGLKNSRLRAEYIGATLWRDVSEAGTLIVLNIAYSPTFNDRPVARPNPAH